MLRRSTAYRLVSLLLICSTCLCPAAVAQVRGLDDQPGPPVLQAYPVDGAVAVNGDLDEAVWQQADVAADFRQFEPSEGAPATEPTNVRVLYGPDHIYVGATLYDDNPGGIRRTLGRRDVINQADWFIVSIDSYFDQKTAYTFAVNAAGVQLDGLRSDGGDGGPDGLPGVDASWDAVWASGVQATSEGWTVEMRIPYSMLRFAEADVQTWGIHFARRISRLGEESEWPLVPRIQRGNLVARYGRLEGLRGIAPRRNVQITPYAVTRMQTEENLDAPGTALRNGSVDVGGDLKLSLGPGITLDATINPDFGQVESDPAVLNLTAFETFYDERRPFFVEGTQIYQFDVGPGQLLYTRRIGAVDPIVGAAKLSGRTARGLSFGVLGATTGTPLDPTRHYAVGRLSQQIGAYSSAGGIITGFHAPIVGGHRNSLAAGADWDLRLAGNRYGLEGFAAVTHRHHTAAGLDTETGVAGKIWARKRQGTWSGFVGLDIFGDAFNPNDMGQLRENNFIATLLRIDHEVNGGRPFGPFQRASLENFNVQRFAYRDGLHLGLETSLEARGTLHGFQNVGLDLSLNNPFGGYDLFETRGLGPWARPLTVQAGAEIETDARRAWLVEPEFSFTIQDGGGRGYMAGLRADWNVGDRLSLSGNVEAEWEENVVAWSSNESFRRTGSAWMIGVDSRPPAELEPDDYVAIDDGGLLDDLLSGIQPVTADHYFVSVFGARDTRSVDVTLRSTVTFRPNLSLQLYSQLFLARGRYDTFQILQNRDDLAPFTLFPKRDDFAFSSLQSNLVLRWEYRPGSTLFLVWTHGRRADDRRNPLAPWGPSPYDRHVGDQIADTFEIFPENVFLIKLNYTFLR